VFESLSNAFSRGLGPKAAIILQMTQKAVQKPAGNWRYPALSAIKIHPILNIECDPF
jgi:hypothetical protein